MQTDGQTALTNITVASRGLLNERKNLHERWSTHSLQYIELIFRFTYEEQIN